MLKLILFVLPLGLDTFAVSAALLVGLGANAAFGWWWADPIAALAVAGVALREARESWRGDGCCAP